MVAFESSVAHLPNVVMRNNLSNEASAVPSLWGMDNVAYLFPSVPRSQRPFPFPGGETFQYHTLLNVHWPFRNSDSSVTAVTEWQCRPHCVFSFSVKAVPLVAYLLIPLLLTPWLSLKHFYEGSIYMSLNTVSCVSEKSRRL